MNVSLEENMVRLTIDNEIISLEFDTIDRLNKEFDSLELVLQHKKVKTSIEEVYINKTKLYIVCKNLKKADKLYKNLNKIKW